MKLCVPSLILALALSLSACGGGGGGGGSDSSGLCEDINLRITGGEQCKTGETPVVAVVAYFSNGSAALCTGTLISLSSVLTAAHCVCEPGTIRFQIIVNQVAHNVTSATAHPQYNAVTNTNDVAVLKLAQPLAIGPVPLLLSDPVAVGETIKIFGYGIDENGQDVFDTAANSPKAGEMVVSVVEESLFAAMYDTTDTSACHGDSGGPVMQNHDGRVGIVGLTLGGDTDTCVAGSMAVFTSIQNPTVYNFILSQVPDAATL